MFHDLRGRLSGGGGGEWRWEDRESRYDKLRAGEITATRPFEVAYPDGTEFRAA